MPREATGCDRRRMRGIAEVFVGVPHLVAVDRLPGALTAGGVTVELSGAAGAVDVVGSLRAHAARARWRAGRRQGDATYEVLRTHDDRCAVTVVLDGLGCDAARAVATALRAALLEAPARTPGAVVATPVGAEPARRPA